MKDLNSDVLIRCVADIEQVEQISLAERKLPDSTYEVILKTAQAYPDHLAIRYIENGEVWKSAKDRGESTLSVDLTYSELLSGINRTANALRFLGVCSTDVVSMLLPNLPETHFALWGAEACGIVNPINYLLEAEEIGAIVQSAGTKVLLIMGDHPELDISKKLDAIRSHAPCVEHVVVLGKMPIDAQECLSFSDLLGQHSGDELSFERKKLPDDVASLFHTGGTTGLPKLAQHTHLNEVYTSWAMNLLLHTQPSDCILTGLPMFHCNAAIASGLTTFTRGGAVLLAGINGYRSPGIVKNMFALIEHYGVTNFTAVPTIYAVLAQLPAEDYDLSTIKTAGCGAAPMPVELFHKFERATGIRALEGYGLTEATVVSTMIPPAEQKPRIGSIGLRLPYTQIKAVIIDAEGNYVRDCEIDEVGTVVIFGPSVSPGYTDTTKNASLFVEDTEGRKWLNTGDLARQDEDGYFWLTGRSKELIIRGGHNIDPKSIEEALAAHPAVNLAAAIGRPDSYAGEVPVAYVDTVAQTNEADLLDYCQNNIGERAAIPKAIVILEQLPVTGVGKIHKPTLHLMELKSVVERELDAFSDKISECEVLTESDTKLGNVARISVCCVNPDEALQLEKDIRQTLGAFSFSFILDVEK